MSRITIIMDPKQALFYSLKIPDGMYVVGVMTRGFGDTGVLALVLKTGIFVQVNTGAIRSLPQDEIRTLVNELLA